MRILNFGSLNLDHVYGVEHFVRPGETLAVQSYRQFCGGKGANQSIALARAGAHVMHAGRIGTDGLILRQNLEKNGVDCSLLITGNEPTGHAVIQVSATGENCILVCGGANTCITQEQIRDTFRDMTADDILVLQNEINAMAEIITAASEKGMKIFFNPAPMNSAVLRMPLDKISTFIVNETEGAELAELPAETPPEEIIRVLNERYPHAAILLTLGARGAVYSDRKNSRLIHVPACPVKHVADTTAAGDTFMGYFTAGTAQGRSLEDTLNRASRAAAICVSRPGAADSIPRTDELEGL